MCSLFNLEIALSNRSWMSGFKTNNSIRLTCPALRVRNINKALVFYEQTLGLKRWKSGLDRHGNLIYYLGLDSSTQTEEPLLELHHDPDAKNAAPSSAGLFHFAILVPDRKSLASTYVALKNSGVSYDGFADHLVSESLYLRDPENNGIEIYHDRRPEYWPRDTEGNILMDTLPLDIPSLVAELGELDSEHSKSFPAGARIGHVHLKVTNLRRSVKFYQENLGFHVTLDWTPMGAVFLSSGGYHHHIGMNTWHSLNGLEYSNNVIGLKDFTIIVSNISSFNKIKTAIEKHNLTLKRRVQVDMISDSRLIVSDPDGIQIVIKSE